MPAAKSAHVRSTTHCVDAGVVVRLLSPGYPEVPALWREFRRSKATLVAPLLLRYEVTNSFHRMRRAGTMTDTEVSGQLRRALELPIDYHDEVGLHGEAARIAARFGQAATYDAHYLALAERLGIDLWTTDRRLVKAVGDQLPWVRLVS